MYVPAILTTCYNLLKNKSIFAIFYFKVIHNVSVLMILTANKFLDVGRNCWQFEISLCSINCLNVASVIRWEKFLEFRSLWSNFQFFFFFKFCSTSYLFFSVLAFSDFRYSQLAFLVVFEKADWYFVSSLVTKYLSFEIWQIYSQMFQLCDVYQLRVWTGLHESSAWDCLLHATA